MSETANPGFIYDRSLTEARAVDIAMELIEQRERQDALALESLKTVISKGPDQIITAGQTSEDLSAPEAEA